MNKKNIFAAALAIATLLPVCMSCSEHADEENPMNETEKQMVSIQTRTAEGTPDIDWPLTLYAFDKSTGRLVTSTTAEDTEDATKLQLNSGNYTLVALAGTTDLSLPEKPELTDGIGIPANGILTHAPQMSIADISVGKNELSQTMNLSYPVAKISLTLNDMPHSTTSATATFTNLYGSIAFDGTTSGTSSPTLTLTQQTDESWTSGTLHVLPSSGPLTLDIQANTETYTIQTQGTIEAGKSYNLTGRYKGKVETNIAFTTLGWTNGNDIDFEMKDKDTNIGSETSIVTLSVSTIPSAKTMCEGHFVADISDKTETSAILLLMSLDEWECIPSLAPAFINSYNEAGLTEWRIPTVDEMKTLATMGTQQSIEGTNNLLTEANGKALKATANYLCENGERTFTMGAEATTTASEANTSTKYQLRAVKTVRVTTSD